MLSINLSSLMQFHENQKVIAWWHKAFFPFLTWFSFNKRRTLLAIGALWVGVRITQEYTQDASKQGIQLGISEFAAVIVLLLLFLWLVYMVAVKFAHLPSAIKKHPLYALHLFYWGFLIALWNTGSQATFLHNVLFVFALIFPHLLWRCCYVLQSGQQGRAVKSKFSDHLLTLLPIYGGSETPYGKGFDFLSKFEAKDELTLAKSQLAGVKLFLLAEIWKLLRKFIEAFIYGPATNLTEKFGGVTLGVPTLGELASLGGQAPFIHSWLSLYLELFVQVLHHAAHGLVIVGVLRFFGFNIFRNTYKPLLAESIIEFWNRYYYYFKELLVNFFFMPTFMQFGKTLKNQPKLRLFAAVFASAFIGNMYYHLIEKSMPVALGGVAETILSLRSRFFYCLLLAIGIYISMLREQKRAGNTVSNAPFSRCVRIFGVWTFFGLIYIWNVRGGATFTARTEFFLHLFGVSLS